ncbi:MAG: U32 family peptidase [Oscillospiraceae bacterium]|nr:U32 family peptidase [Oscillospiraceae bacterium]
MLEILSPAGSPEAVVAAVQSGADAIYVGLDAFNARRGAKNFTNEEFIDAVTYCHARSCKVYVTVNTLVSDREIESVAQLGRFISRAGADAAIVQDLGVARILREVCPDLPLHASTQMSIHNLAGAIAAYELGMTRVVLARELTLEQIAHIAKNSPVEVEVFVHGALCFCHSGQCYMSALIGRRSGNRGMCAQPCRLQYSMGRMSDQYPLSLKDNCLINHIDALVEAGVKCVKIEGRMKRPEYCAVVTSIYSKVIHDRTMPTEKDFEALELAFSRDGFTDGYLTGEKNDMFGVRTEQGRETTKLFNDIRHDYAMGERRRVGVKFYAVVRRGETAKLLVVDEEGHRASVEGPVAQPAVNAPLTEQGLREQLHKTGGTQFKCLEVKTTVDNGLFLPAAAINEMRRNALEELTVSCVTPPKRREGNVPAFPHETRRAMAPVLTVQVRNAEQLIPEMAELNPHTVYVPLEVIVENPKKLRPFNEKGIEVAAILPRIITDSELPEVSKLLKQAKDIGIDTVLCANLGHIALAKLAGMRVRGDFGLNAFNSYTMDILSRAGLSSVTASFEMRMAQVRDLKKSIDTELIVYGRLPLMITDQCIIKRSSGNCTCQNNHQLSDRMGSIFPVMKEFGCRNVIYNSHKLFLADKSADINASGVWAQRLIFTTETARECLRVMERYLGLNDYEPNGITRGLYYRGVE